MYNLRSWRSHLDSMGIHLLHEEPARTMGDSFTAFVPGEIIQVLRMTAVHPTFEDNRRTPEIFEEVT